MSRRTTYATSDFLNCPAVRCCLPLDQIPHDRMTPEEKQQYFHKHGGGYVQISGPDTVIDQIRETKTFISYLRGALPFITDLKWQTHTKDRIEEQTQLLQQLQQGVRV